VIVDSRQFGVRSFSPVGIVALPPGQRRDEMSRDVRIGAIEGHDLIGNKTVTRTRWVMEANRMSIYKRRQQDPNLVRVLGANKPREPSNALPRINAL